MDIEHTQTKLKCCYATSLTHRKKINIPSLSTTSGGKRRVAKALLMMLENSWLKKHQQKLMLNCIFKSGYKNVIFS